MYQCAVLSGPAHFGEIMGTRQIEGPTGDRERSHPEQWARSGRTRMVSQASRKKQLCPFSASRPWVILVPTTRSQEPCSQGYLSQTRQVSTCPQLIGHIHIPGYKQHWISTVVQEPRVLTNSIEQIPQQQQHWTEDLELESPNPTNI